RYYSSLVERVEAQLRRRQMQREHAPTARAACVRNRTALQLRECARDRETEPGAPRIRNSIRRTEERLEDPRQIFIANAGAAIRYGEHEPRTITCGRELDRLRGRRIPRRVLEQIAD